MKSMRILALPHGGILLGVILSFAAWCLPPVSSAGKGFTTFTPTVGELLSTLGAYGLIGASAAAGYRIGGASSKRLPSVSEASSIDLRDRAIWTMLIVLGSIGVLATLRTVIGALGIGSCLEALMHFNANVFKLALYEEYSRGILSLRYIAILAGAIGIFRFLVFGEISWRTIVSFLTLAFVALVSSRLSILAAVIAGGTAYLLYPADRPHRKIPPSRWFLWLGSLVFILGLLTISRTYGYYRQLGAESFVSAAGTEFQRYLGAPFQGSIEAVCFDDSIAASDLSEAGGIDSTLNTNSAILNFALVVGHWNILLAMGIVSISGFACGLMRPYHGTYLVLIVGVLQTCHLEFWRISLFQQGITITLLVTIVGLSLARLTVRLPRLSVVGMPKLSLSRMKIRNLPRAGV